MGNIRQAETHTQNDYGQRELSHPPPPDTRQRGRRINQCVLRIETEHPVRSSGGTGDRRDHRSVAARPDCPGATPKAAQAPRVAQQAQRAIAIGCVRARSII